MRRKSRNGSGKIKKLWPIQQWSIFSQKLSSFQSFASLCSVINHRSYNGFDFCLFHRFWGSATMLRLQSLFINIVLFLIYLLKGKNTVECQTHKCEQNIFGREQHLITERNLDESIVPTHMDEEELCQNALLGPTNLFKHVWPF